MSLPPMVYFDKNFKAQQVKSDIATEALKAENSTTQDIYYAFFHNARLGPSLFARGKGAQKAAALKIATWASHHLFGNAIYSLESRDSLRGYSAPVRVFHILECFYHCLLLSRFYVPRGNEDKMISAVLDSSSWLETGAWQSDRMVRVELDVTRSYLGGDPNKPCDVHEVTFADAATLYVAEHKGRLLFVGGDENRAPIPALCAALQKILAANAVVGKVRGHIRGQSTACDFSENQFIGAVIKNIRDVHIKDPMALISADQISTWADDFRAKILVKTQCELEGAS